MELSALYARNLASHPYGSDPQYGLVVLSERRLRDSLGSRWVEQTAGALSLRAAHGLQHRRLRPFRKSPLKQPRQMDTQPGQHFVGTGEGARWGDFSWAVADGNSLWLATEYIPGGIDSTVYDTNFGTFIYQVGLH